MAGEPYKRYRIYAVLPPPLLWIARTVYVFGSIIVTLKDIRRTVTAQSGIIMAFWLDTDRHGDLLYIVFAGAVDDAELAAVEAEVRATPAFKLGADVLADCTGISELQVTGTGLYALALRTQRNQNLLAIVAKPGFLYGMARMYEIMANWAVERVQVFVDRSAAAEWIKHTRSANDSAAPDSATLVFR
jgi:hypothetical protein